MSNDNQSYFADNFWSPNRFCSPTSIDKTKLERLEAKCYDYPLSDEEWQQIIGTAPMMFPNSKRCRCVTYRTDQEILGFYVYVDDLEDFDKLELIRLGVHPDHRQKGYGTLILDDAISLAHRQGKPEVEITIPEYWLDPEENRGVLSFTHTSGLVSKHHVRDRFYHYGKNYDGIVYRSGGSRKLVTV